MSGTSRQARRRAGRAAREQRGEAETRTREARSLLEAVEAGVSDLAAPAAKLDPCEPAVLKRLRRYLRRTGVAGVLDELLGDHPGRRSSLSAEALLLGALMSNWQRCSYLRTDIAVQLLRLPAEAKTELGILTGDGREGLKYRTLHKRLSRLEALLRGQTGNGGRYGLAWLEKTMIAHSVPEEARGSVKAVALDETAFESWHLLRRHEAQAQVNKEVLGVYRQRHPGTPAPGMSSPQMRAIAAELGTPLGADGRVERTPADPDARAGHKTATSKHPSDKYLGYSTATVFASRSHTLSRNSDKATPGPPVRQYALATTCWPANTNPGPGGLRLLQDACELAPEAGHVFADMGFTNKSKTFTTPLRRAGIGLHMALPETAAGKHRVVMFDQRGGRRETVIEHCGALYHKFMPPDLLKRSYAERRHWRWTPTNHLNGGAIRFMCPFHAGTIHNRRLRSYKHRRPGSEPVGVPDDADGCCNGTFVAQPEQLPRYQTPDHGSDAHRTLKGLRNPSEGGFGNIKTKGGLSPASCRAKGQPAHSLASLFAHIAHNLQLAMNDEIEKLKAARQAKQQRQQQAAARKQHQQTADGSQRAETDPLAPQAHNAAPDQHHTHRDGLGAAAATRAPP